MMAKKIVTLMLTLTLLAGFSVPSFIFAQSVDDIILMTENYPPFNFMDNGYLQGISVDLMVSILKKLNSKQSRDNIELLPWARGYQNLLKEKHTCLFSTTRSEAREHKFKWVGPISPTTVSLTARKDRHIKIDSVKDIEKFSVGVAVDDIGEQLLIQAGIELKKLDRIGGMNVIQRSIHKLNLKRIDLISYEENALKWEIKNMGLNPDDYETVYTLKNGGLYYTFHINTPDSLIQKFQTALDELKKDGTYQKIVNRYLK